MAKIGKFGISVAAAAYRAAKWRFVSRLEHFRSIVRLYRHDFEKQPPYFVFTIGKVGSRTVADTLRASLAGVPVYHVHNLSKPGIRRVDEYFQQNLGRRSLALQNNWIMRKKLDRAQGIQWPVITLVRDPIARHISGFFYHARLLHPEAFDARGCIDEDRTVAILEKRLLTLPEQELSLLNWFDDEMKPAFGIDVYDYEFDPAAGYSIAESPHVRLLTLKTESLDRSLESALREFIPDKNTDFRVQRTNAAADKQYADTYRRVVQRVRVSPEACRAIYDSRFARHFFSAEERRALSERWSGRERKCA